ncbi:MAG: hypothetical protein ACREUA_09420 [Burkholderiales bacterium]
MDELPGRGLSRVPTGNAGFDARFTVQIDNEKSYAICLMATDRISELDATAENAGAEIDLHRAAPPMEKTTPRSSKLFPSEGFLKKNWKATNKPACSSRSIRF